MKQIDEDIKADDPMRYMAVAIKQQYDSLVTKKQSFHSEMVPAVMKTSKPETLNEITPKILVSIHKQLLMLCKRYFRNHLYVIIASTQNS